MSRANLLCLFVCVFFSSLYSEDRLLPKGVEGNENLVNLESEPSTLINHAVNAITGDYCDSQTDLILPGPRPLILERAYMSSDRKKGSLYNSWNLNHCGTIHLRTRKKRNEAVWYDAFGGRKKFSGDRVGPDDYAALQINPDDLKLGVTNCGFGVIGGRTNLKNTHIEYCYNKQSCIVNQPNATRKYFHKYKGTFYLNKEENPFGHQFQYTYEKKSRINSISSITPQGLLTAKIDILYQPEDQFKNNLELEVIASDGRKIKYTFKKTKHSLHNRHTGYFLSEVYRPNAPWEKYHYKHASHKIIRKERPDGRFLGIDYYSTHKTKSYSGKVKSLKAPVGVDETPITTHRFKYKLHTEDGTSNSKIIGGYTEVKDAYNRKTVFHFNGQFRLTTISNYSENGSLYSSERLHWGKYDTEEASQLVSREFRSRLDKCCLFLRHYAYDSHGNIVCDRLYGNLSGRNEANIRVTHTGEQVNPECEAYCCCYQYDNENRLTVENDGNREIHFSYVGKSDLLQKKLTLSNQKIHIREGFWYDNDGVLIRQILDNGSSSDLDNLTGVTERKIHILTPTTQYPFGMPQVIEEKCLNLQSGNEILLKKVVNTYSTAGHLVKQDLYDADGQYVHTRSWEYDDHGNVILEVDPVGQTISRRYDANDNLIFEQDFDADFYKELSYDFSNRLIREEEVYPDKRLATTHRYDYLNNRIATVDWYGNETEFVYDAFSRLIETRSPLKAIVRKAYNALGHVILHEDPNGGQTLTKYTVRGQPAYVAYPDGSTETTLYSVDGKVLEKVAQNGVKTAFSYDYLSRPIREDTYASDGSLYASVHKIYDAFHLIEEIDAKGNAIHYAYDPAGRLQEKRNGNSRVVYCYDAQGRNHKTLEYTSQTEYSVQVSEYDLLDRIIEERTEDSVGHVLRKKGYIYDGMGNRSSLIEYTESGIAVSTTQYESHGLPILTQDPTGNETRTIIYYDRGHPYRETIDPKGNVTETIYDALGRVASITQKNPIGTVFQKVQFAYDLAGNQTKRIETVFTAQAPERTVTTSWEYDALNREIKRIEAVGTLDQKSLLTCYNQNGQREQICKPNGVHISYTYDLMGRLSAIAASDGSIAYSYSYDLNNNIVEERDHLAHSIGKRHYDGNNRLAIETLGNGLETCYVYDGKGRPVEVKYFDDTTVSYIYNAAGLSSINRFDASYEYTFDLAGRVSTLQGPSGQISYRYDLGGKTLEVSAPQFNETVENYDQAGNVLRTTLTSPSPLKQKVCDYTYDDLNQLETEPNHTYKYDSLYNRVAKDGKESTPNALNQLQHESLAYDPCGNLIRRRGDVYGYDAWDRLTSAITASGIYKYVYDSNNRRMSKHHYSSAGQLISITRYLYHGENEVGTVDSRNRIKELRLLGEGKGAEIGAAVRLELCGEAYTPIHDHNGNLVGILDGKGLLIEQYSYSAFGEEDTQDDKDPISPWRFSSKRVDPETGLVFFGRRYYAPELGRWITQDPMGFQAGPNLYAFVNNNPLTHIDLYGLIGLHRRVNWFSKLTYYLGYALKMIGDNVIPIPIVNIAVSGVGYLMMNRSLKNFSPNHDHSANYFTAGLQLAEWGGSTTFCPGMMTEKDDSCATGWKVSEKFGHKCGYIAHNATHGFIMDLLECIVVKLGFRTNAVNKTIACIKYQIQEVGGVNSGKIIVVIAHSQGGINLDMALRYLTDKEKKMLHIYTFGSGKMISSKGVGRAVNFVSKRDPVPFIADIPGHIRGFFAQDLDIQYLDSDAPYFTDHAFDGDTYRMQLEKVARKYI